MEIQAQLKFSQWSQTGVMQKATDGYVFIQSQSAYGTFGDELN